jgi:hypothetical protein
MQEFLAKSICFAHFLYYTNWIGEIQVYGEFSQYLIIIVRTIYLDTYERFLVSHYYIEETRFCNDCSYEMLYLHKFLDCS